MSENLSFESLEALLEKERLHLLEGDLEGLGSLLPMKEKLVEIMLCDVDANREWILPMEKKLRRNQLLLGGALDGIRSVATRLAALRQVQMTLDTYDAHGRKQRVATPKPPTLEKRA
tara:strand:- start:103 stop:453 length:351 start_codon:yes stop_codon:yes gene_type:complete